VLGWKQPLVKIRVLHVFPHSLCTVIISFLNMVRSMLGNTRMSLTQAWLSIAETYNSPQSSSNSNRTCSLVDPLPRQHEAEVRDCLRALRGQDISAKVQAANRIAHCCKSRQEGRSFKEEICRQGVVQVMVQAVGLLEEQKGQLELRLSLFRAIAESVYDHRGNAGAAAESGLLMVTANGLRKANGDEVLIEHQLCATNNVVGMNHVSQRILEEAGILPLLVEISSSRSRGSSKFGQQIATAALANLTNNAQLRDHLIKAGAVQSLSNALHQYRPEEEEGAVEVPSVSYMQSLSAVVKVVGSGCLIGKQQHARHRELSRGQDDDDSLVFRVQGDRSSSHCDLAIAEALVVDRRSALWMLQYLEAAVDGCPYPPDSNIYGTTWKVALSIACMANGCAANRKLLAEVGAWRVLFRALGKEGRDKEDRVQ